MKNFYSGLTSSIRLWIDEVGQEQLVWDGLVRVVNWAKAKVLIYNFKELDQRYLQGKQPLKLTLEKQGEQPKRESYYSDTKRIGFSRPKS